MEQCNSTTDEDLVWDLVPDTVRNISNPCDHVDANNISLLVEGICVACAQDV